MKTLRFIVIIAISTVAVEAFSQSLDKVEPAKNPIYVIKMENAARGVTFSSKDKFEASGIQVEWIRSLSVVREPKELIKYGNNAQEEFILIEVKEEFKESLPQIVKDRLDAAIREGQ